MADQGKVALRRDDVDFSDLKHSFAAFFGLVCFPVTREAARVRHAVVGDW